MKNKFALFTLLGIFLFGTYTVFAQDNQDTIITEEVIAEEVSAKCAPGWVAAKDGIFCSPAIFRQLDVARQSDNKCWEGGMLLRCRE